SSCININADDVILDCNNSMINTSGMTYKGNAINIINANNFIIKNCNFISKISGIRTINLENSNNGIIENNLFNITDLIGIMINNSADNIIKSNTFVDNCDIITTYGIAIRVLGNSINNVIDNNNIDFCKIKNGILIDSNKSIIINNNFNFKNTQSKAIKIFGGNDINIINNLFNLEGSNSYGLYLIYGTDNIFLKDSVFSVSDSIGLSASIFISDNASLIIYNTTLNTISNGGYDIYAGTTAMADVKFVYTIYDSNKILNEGQLNIYPNLEDKDFDLFDSDVDCNDNDASINPSAVEICDSIDNNCDGNIDENVMNTYFQDLDDDNFGDLLVNQSSCSLPLTLFALVSTDCNDSDLLINPDVAEINDNSIDENCDGILGVTSALGPSGGGGSSSNNHPSVVTEVPIVTEPVIEDQTLQIEDTNAPAVTGAATTETGSGNLYISLGIIAFLVLITGFFVYKKYF
ncbi:MAG: putative metal-binding motif-containing protein, partial [Nanoarchaeota archaeon]|nr:putative metal-binding motif-containing protein [Nanoarchaeota archaeon]